MVYHMGTDILSVLSISSLAFINIYLKNMYWKTTKVYFTKK